MKRSNNLLEKKVQRNDEYGIKHNKKAILKLQMCTGIPLEQEVVREREKLSNLASLLLKTTTVLSNDSQ